MILYFSASGNSRYVAKLTAQALNEERVCLNDRIKNNDFCELHSEKPFVLVCPVFAWRIPRIVEEHLQKSSLTGSDKVYLLVTTCGSSGNTGEYAQRFFEKLGKHFMGWHTFYMPGSYVAFMENPDPAQAPRKNAAAKEALSELLPLIREEKRLPTFLVTGGGRFMSWAANPFFYRHIIGKPGFYSTESCIGCGKCEKVCPLNNIVMDGAKPRWNDHCTHCMACVHRCPKQAIEFRKITIGKNRFYNHGET